MAQPTPTAVHPDTALTGPVSRDFPAGDFIALLERSGADADLLDRLRADW